MTAGPGTIAAVLLASLAFPLALMGGLPLLAGGAWAVFGLGVALVAVLAVPLMLVGPVLVPALLVAAAVLLLRRRPGGSPVP